MVKEWYLRSLCYIDCCGLLVLVWFCPCALRLDKGDGVGVCFGYGVVDGVGYVVGYVL